MQTQPSDFDAHHLSFPLVDRFAHLRDQEQLHLFAKRDFLDLIEHHKGQMEYAEALTVSDFALTIHLLDAELLMLKTDLLLENKRPQEALAMMSLLEKVCPDEISILCLRARAMFQLDENELARALLAGAKSWAPTSRMAEILLLEASLLQRTGEKEEAYQRYKEILTLEPRNRTALEKIWLASESSRNQKDSLAFHLVIIDRDPYNGMAWFNCGQAYYYLLRYEEALEAFEYAGMLEPQFSLAFCYAAEVALAIGQPKRALKNLYDILQRSHDPGILKLMAQSYQALQIPGKARQYFLQARNLDPLDDDTYYQLGKIYMHEGKPSIAARYFERAVNLDDRNEEYMLALAEAWYQEGRTGEAEACMVRATEIAPEIPEPWIRYALVHWQREDWDGTLHILEDALEHTWDSGIYYLMAAAQIKKGQRKEAFRSLEEALGEGYESHDVFFTYLPDMKQDKDVKAILRYFA